MNFVFRSPFSVLTFFAVLLLWAPPASAQQHFSVGTFASYCIPNSSKWGYISGWGSGVEFGLWKQQQWLSDDGNTLVRQPYNMGLRFNFTAFPEGIAGHRFGFVGFVQEPVPFVPGLFIDMAFNAALYTNPYYHSHDTMNVFIGSYVNCLINVGLVYKIDLGRESSLTVGGNFAHSSNGYLFKPNKGLNYIQFGLGYDLPVKNHDTEIQKSLVRQRPRGQFKIQNSQFSILLSYAPGFVMSRYTPYSDRRYYYAHTARVGFQYNFNRVRAAGLTLDLTNNTSQDSIRRANHDFPLPFNTALTAHYETWFNRLSLHVGLGVYLASSSYVFKPYYERVGLFYYFGDDDRPLRHFVGVSLKAHATRIDFIEWHYGIKLKCKQKN